MTEFESIETASTRSSPNRYAQLSNSLLWLNERAWPLTVGILVTAGLYLYQYILEEKIPLSITSSAFLTALPAMSAILVIIISVLVAFILLPIFVLFHRLNASDKRLSDDFSFEQRSPEQNARHRRLLGRWVGGLLILGIFCTVFSVVGSQVTSNLWWTAAAVLGAGLTFFAYDRLMTLRVEGPVSTEFRMVCLMSAFVQIVVILNVTIVAIDIAGRYVSSLWWLLLLVPAELFFLGMIQLLGALFVVKMQGHDHPAAFLAIAVMAVVVALGLHPASGAKLGGFALQLSSSGARNCTIMSVDQQSVGLEAILDPDRPGFSRPLRVLAEADGTYLVRPWKTDAKGVRFVPRASVNGVDACPIDSKTARQAAAQNLSG
ncbi:hypothetical protein PS918_03207 [Pseudomonas fluorescens]|uniref:Uncharacterized protein n=1 Tax=Pseudomonas fluorescens TaxID=294 RepID=A0A5E7SXZ2_PSEFL|nr:hypothetical protein [Pseudomonas fluorescens]VVP90728.1 hypothetical protein PS918_03207 [Pseudomonas fluorescens]